MNKENFYRTTAEPREFRKSDEKIIQKNLLYITNLPGYIKSEEIASEAFIGKVARVKKVVISEREMSSSAFVTVENEEQVKDAISEYNNTIYKGKNIRLFFGTTKYCYFFMKNEQCPNPNCLFLHSKGGKTEEHKETPKEVIAEEKNDSFLTLPKFVEEDICYKIPVGLVISKDKKDYDVIKLLADRRIPFDQSKKINMNPRHY